MEKRVFLAVLLCVIVLVLYQTYVVPPTPPPGATTTAPAGSTTAAPANTAPGGGTMPTPAQTSAPAVAPAPVQTLVSDSLKRDVVVDTNDVHAVFSSEGGVLTSWQLKHYFDDGKPLDLVPKSLPESVDVGQPGQPRLVPLVRPFTLSTDDAAASARLSKALFRPSAESLDLKADSGTLTFEYADASGLQAKKTFHFQLGGRPYVLGVDASITIGGKAHPVTVAWGPAVAPGYSAEGSRESQPNVPVQARVDSFERLGVKDRQEYDGAFRYAGVSGHYFLSAIIAPPQSKPADWSQLRVEYQPLTLPVPAEDVDNTKKNATRSLVAYSVTTPGATSLTYFVGPKDFEGLKAIDPDLTRVIDFGMFRWLVVPLLQALKWVHGYINNWGWSIIVLTVLMNVLIFPLRHRSMVSMKKMQALQPEIKAIQERYKKYKITDPERQKANEETMALYKQKGVNPASGCVPMLLTFPILFAFYNLLASSIELRGAPFFGWIHDLSLHDPYYITPVIMAATMFWQQRMMPQPGADPVQQKIFMFMPLIFLYTFLWAPAGLAIYWFSSNLLAIGQQYLTNRIIGGAGPSLVPAKVTTAPRR